MRGFLTSKLILRREGNMEKEKTIDMLTDQIKKGVYNNSILKIKINKNGYIEYITKTQKIKLQNQLNH